MKLRLTDDLAFSHITYTGIDSERATLLIDSCFLEDKIVLPPTHSFCLNKAYK